MGGEVFEIMTENELVSVNVGDIPDIIASNIDSISKLESQVRTAEESANKAMDYVGKQMTRYQEKDVWLFKYRSGDTKDIIEDTQEAVEKLATAQQVSVEALKKSFEFQKKLAETSKYLFDLGCANITVNRIAVRAIELKLSGASKETLSDLAKQEMMAVVKQLKEQEDILKKQEFLNSKVKEHASRLDGKDTIDKEQSEKIEHHHQKLSEIHDALTVKDRIDTEQTHRLEELMVILQNNDLIDTKQELSIAENRTLIDKNSEAIKILIEYTKQKDLMDKEQSEKIESLSVENKHYHQKLSEIHDVLTANDRINAEQTYRLEELMALLKNNDSIDKKQESSIAENRALIDKNSEAIKILIEYTKQKDLMDKEQSNEIATLKNVLQKKLCIKAIAISLASLVCCIAVVTYILLR